MAKKFVFDSSTAILLAKINLMELTATKYHVILPKKVKEEITKKMESFDAKLILKLIGDNKASIVKANNKKVKKLVNDFNIDEGEAEALQIAHEKNYILATDDGPSIKTSKLLNIKFTTAIHFLVYFYKQTMIDKISALEKLKLLEKYGRYSYDIIKDAKSKIGGEENG